jgi:hypothetical protein
MKKLAVFTMSLFFLFGCASTTLIKSNPPGANVSINGILHGETPLYYTDKAVAGTSKMVTLKKEDYKEFTGTIRREKFSVPALIGGIFLVVPFVWILEYPPQYNFEMERL